jgi:hypothetical protein
MLHRRRDLGEWDQNKPALMHGWVGNVHGRGMKLAIVV